MGKIIKLYNDIEEASVSSKEVKPKKGNTIKFIIWLLGLLFFCGYGVVSFYFDIYRLIIK